MNINEITAGMTPQDKEIYFKHMEKRHKEEVEKWQAEKEHLKKYKRSLINDILSSRTDFTADELEKKAIRTLEKIAY